MPPVPLVDSATLDFSKIQYSRRDIDRILPHRGAMALVDGILYADVPRRMVVGYKDIRHDEFWADGHFPGNPILPGVVMIEAGGQLAVFLYKLVVPEMMDKLIVFGGVDDARFRGVVRPGSRVVVAVKGEEVNRRLAKCRCQAIQDGKVVYEGVILGIPT